jgi:hypothetical protein
MYGKINARAFLLSSNAFPFPFNILAGKPIAMFSARASPNSP